MKTMIDEEKIETVFYNTWEDIIERLSDEQLDATMYMIKRYNDLNKLIDEQYRYRNEIV